MNFLFVGINYAPELTSVAPFTTGLCERLRERGHRVTVVTAFPYYPQWRIHDGYRGHWYQREEIQGVDVRRVIHFVPSKPRNFLQRLMHDLTFSWNALFAALAVGKVDAIICSSPPPFVPIVCWIVSRLRGASFVIKVTDLASDAAVSLRIMQGRSFLTRCARALESFGYNRAAGINVLCPAFKETLAERGVSGSKIEVIPDWADVDRIRPLPLENVFRETHQLNGEFVALHAGNMGLKQGLRTVVEAARIANETSRDITFLMVGDGEERTELQRLAGQYRLSRFRFLPLQPLDVLPYMLAAADVLVLTQRADVTGSVIPSKLLTYMAAGRPIVACAHADSVTARFMQDASCGFLVPPENPGALLDALCEVRRNPSEAAQLGKNGRAYAEQNFSKGAVLQRYERFLDRIFSFPTLAYENSRS